GDDTVHHAYLRRNEWNVACRPCPPCARQRCRRRELASRGIERGRRSRAVTLACSVDARARVAFRCDHEPARSQRRVPAERSSGVPPNAARTAPPNASDRAEAREPAAVTVAASRAVRMRSAARLRTGAHEAVAVPTTEKTTRLRMTTLRGRCGISATAAPP